MKSSIKSLRYLSVLLVLLSMTSASSALADSAKTVVVTNSTSYIMSEFYASPSDSSGWNQSPSNNLIAGKEIDPGQTTTVTISDGSSDCTYDLMAVMYGASQFGYQYQVDACGGGTWNVSVGQ